MTKEEIATRIAAIKYAANEECDDEAAHAQEDKLREDVLFAIAGGAKNPHELAQKVLLSREIEFSRWCS